MSILSINKILDHLPKIDHKYLLDNRLKIYDSIDSTNTYLLEKIKLNDYSQVFCVAERQTAGRGRLNRSWCSPKGNIYLSMLWQFTKDPLKIAGLNIAMAIAVARTLKKQGISGFSLKWPNDLLYNHFKLAGVLIETILKTNALYAVVGIGINVVKTTVNSAGSKHLTAIPAISMLEISAQLPDLNIIVASLIHNMLELVLEFQLKGLTTLITEWQNQDSTYGKAIIAKSPQEVIYGTNQGINQLGHLLIAITGTSKIRAICSGDFSLRAN